ncbi:portal protein [Enterobacter pseudoroggenkampii]|uniref:portal protein n=1 Tax=Enterobacter pseudoroggenkampii TaxID=2996112 RepID=UPI0022650461|nr:hypothetical protein [Enterobacter pseudoroggenkampii]MCX8289109.1 hypothetical protein [Enterobacter pseudoroggenkampii]
MIIELPKGKEEEIVPLLSRLYNAGDDFMESSYRRDARINWDFYTGALPKPAHSSLMPAVDRSVYSGIETCLKDLVEIFTAGEDAVQFAPVHSEDIYSAKASTQLVNQIFFRNQNGKSLLQDALKTALVERSAIFKVFWSDDEKTTHTVHEKNLADREEILSYIVGLREGGLEINDEDVEIIKNKEDKFDVTLTYTIPREYVKVELLPIEEFICEPSVKTLNSADCSYICHRVLKTKAQLKEYGLTDEELSEMNDDNSDLSGWTVNAARTEYRQNLDDDTGVDSDDPAFRIWLKEHFWKTGVLSDDGSVRLYKVLQAGEGRIIRVEEIFSFPFYVFNPIPTPNNVFGSSFAQSLADLQCDRAWTKQHLHTYFSNVSLPSWQVISQQFKGGDITNPKPGAVYRVEGANAITPVQMPPMPPVDALFNLIDKDREERSGVNVSTAGLSTSGIETNRSSEATVNNMITLATGRVRLMAHSIANGGYSDLIRAIHACFKNNSSRSVVIQTAYGLQEIHPNQLLDRDELIVNLCLTTQEKQKRMQNLNMLVDFMAKVSSVNAAGWIAPQNVAWMIQEMGDSLGFKNTFDYSVPPQQYSPPGMDAGTQVQLENVQADTAYKQAQANKLIADDHHKAEENLFKQQLAVKQEARADKELELKAAYNSDHFNLENNKLAVTAQTEGLKHQHKNDVTGVQNYRAQTENLRVQADIIQKNKELNSEKGAV